MSVEKRVDFCYPGEEERIFFESRRLYYIIEERMVERFVCEIFST